MISWMMAIAVVTQTDAQESQLQDLLSEIRQGQYSKVAVCPRPLYREGSQESFASADFGPLGEKWCQQLTAFLQANASKGGFKLTSAFEVRKAVEGLTVDDLGNAGKMRQLSQATSAQALVVVTATEVKKNWQLQPTLIHLIDNTSREARPEKARIGLSDYAFMGNSFEARRWGPNGLELVGFQDSMPREEGFGMGPNYELTQFAQLKPNLPHPLSTLERVPQSFKLLVNGEKRPFELFAGKLYVRLEPGESFAVELWNQSDRPILAVLYIDGVNTIDKAFETPLETSPSRRWSLAAGLLGEVSGWYSSATKTYESFRVVSKNDSVAFGQSVNSHFGMITAIFYTNGLNGVVVPRGDLALRGTSNGAFAVGRDAAQQIKLNYEKAEAGLLTAAITVNYRTGEELKVLKDTGRVAKGTDGSSGEGKQGGTSQSELPPVTPPPSTTPGEDQPFKPAAKSSSSR